MDVCCIICTESHLVTGEKSSKIYHFLFVTLHLFILLCGRRTKQFQSVVLWVCFLLWFHLMLISLTLVSSVVSVSITATNVI